MKPKILFVDDDLQLLAAMAAVLRKDFAVTTASSPQKGLEYLHEGKRFHVIISDMRMPGMDGIEFLKRAQAVDSDAVRIMLTGYADLETVIAAVNEGNVSHFLTKPCPTDVIRETIDGCVALSSVVDARFEPGDECGGSFMDMVGQSEAATRLRTALHRLSRVDATILFTGESGSGKSLAAEVVHGCSRRRRKPLVRVNCPALSPGVFEAELFGSRKGAYTGSVEDSLGRFMAAQGGSLLLDEIADVPLPLQAKLLQVIERKEFERVGDSRTVKSDVRLMAATNADLLRSVEQGTFRKDLYYRLNVMHVEIPPLRKRIEDIPLLVDRFLSELSETYETRPLSVSDGVLELFATHDWPGNIRQLKHVLERAVVFAQESTIRVDDLPSDLRSPGADAFGVDVPSPSGMSISAALKEAGGNKAKAARLLGISRSTLYRKLGEG